MKPKLINHIQFSRDSGDDFYQELVLEVNNYFTKNGKERSGGRKLIVKMSLLFAINILFYALMLLTNQIGIFLLVYCLMGISMLMISINLSHDAAHNTAVKSKFWNKVIFELSFSMLGSNPFLYKKSHNSSHHAYSNIQDADSDIIEMPFLRMNQNQPLKRAHKYQWFYAPFFYVFYTLHRLLIRDTVLAFITSRDKREMPSAEVIKLILYKIVYFIIMIGVPVAILPFGWPIVLLAFLINHFVLSISIITLLGLTHLTDYVIHPSPNENGKLPMSWSTLQLKASTDYYPDSKTVNALVGGFNAHVIHHLIPDISYVHYTDLLPILQKLTNKHDLPYIQLSFGEMLRAHFRYLKLMGIQKEMVPKISTV